MRLTHLLAAAAASSLIAAPAMANSASSLSVAKAATSAKKSNKLAGDTLLIGLVGGAMVVGTVLAVTDDDTDSN